MGSFKRQAHLFSSPYFLSPQCPRLDVRVGSVTAMGITSPAVEESSTQSKEEIGSTKGSEAGPSSNVLQFVAWASSAEESFWHRLASFKLDTQKLTDDPIAISGTKLWKDFRKFSKKKGILEELLFLQGGGFMSLFLWTCRFFCTMQSSKVAVTFAASVRIPPT